MRITPRSLTQAWPRTAGAVALAMAAACAPSILAAQPAPTRAAAAETPKKSAPAKAAKPAAAKSQSDGGQSSSGSGQSILALVNDEPITAYEVAQRENLALASSQQVNDYIRTNAPERWKSMVQSGQLNEEFKAFAQKHNPQSKEEVQELQKTFVQQRQAAMVEELKRQARSRLRGTIAKQALEQLIDERLMLQEAKRLSVLATDEEVDKVLKGIAERNKMSFDEFANHLKTTGSDISTMRAQFKTKLSWNDVVRRRVGHQVAITASDIDRFVATAPGGEDAGLELQVHRITFEVANAGDQKAMAQRLRDAEALRRRFGGCKSAGELASGAGAKFEDLGSMKPAAIGEPTRSLLLSAKDGEMIPPTLGPGGVELWAVCGRKTVRGDSEKRTAAQEQLRQREFEILARRHLKDLRLDAHIEYR